MGEGALHLLRVKEIEVRSVELTSVKPGKVVITRLKSWLLSYLSKLSSAASLLCDAALLFEISFCADAVFPSFCSTSEVAGERSALLSSYEFCLPSSSCRY